MATHPKHKRLIIILVCLTVFTLIFTHRHGSYRSSQNTFPSIPSVRNLTGLFQWDRDDDETALEVFRIYLEARKAGMSVEEIAKRVFQVKFPNYSSQHLHTYPFLTGDTLRSWSDFVYERIMKRSGLLFNAYTWRKTKGILKNDSVIFVKSDDIEHFAKEVHPSLKINRYILITHNSDYEVPRGIYSRDLLDDAKLIIWFAQNPGIVHPKLKAVPIGFVNRNFPDLGSEITLEIALERILERSPSYKRKYFAYVNFNFDHNSNREPIAKQFEKFSFTPKKTMNQSQYLMDLMNSKFVVSPPGNGEDCHRTWESVLMGSYPIVNNSTLFPLFEKAPTLVVDNWNSIDERSLQSFKPKINNRNIILAQYWFDTINFYRGRV